MPRTFSDAELAAGLAKIRTINPIAVVRSLQTDEYGAIRTSRVYARAEGFEVETVREFYNRSGGRDDYETASVWFASRDEALKAAASSVGSSRDPAPSIGSVTSGQSDTRRSA
jgi:hypothetical protein